MSGIFRDVVSYGAVTACESTEKLAVAVCQADSRSVKFEFTGKCKLISDAFFSPVGKCLHFCYVISVSQ